MIQPFSPSIAWDLILGSWGMEVALKFSPMLAPIGLFLNALSAIQVKPTSWTGMYISPVLGLNDMGIQLWAPCGLGAPWKGLPFSA